MRAALDRSGSMPNIEARNAGTDPCTHVIHRVPSAGLGRLQRLPIHLTDDSVHWLYLPPPTAEALPGIPWCTVDAAFSVAAWALHAWRAHVERGASHRHALGRDLREEVAVCLLGGHGMPAELGLAAFARIRDAGMFDAATPTASAIETLLRTPLLVRGRTMHYRFPRTKARFLAAAFEKLSTEAAPADAVALRDWLLAIPGIGPKTASWVVRNRLANAPVAILDVHVIRACQILGLFPMDVRLPREYATLERAFIRLAEVIGLPPGDVDAVMWSEMRQAPRTVSDALDACARGLSREVPPVRVPRRA